MTASGAQAYRFYSDAVLSTLAAADDVHFGVALHKA
jgi:hypothetical protein